MIIFKKWSYVHARNYRVFYILFMYVLTVPIQKTLQVSSVRTMKTVLREWDLRNSYSGVIKRIHTLYKFRKKEDTLRAAQSYVM